MMNKRLSTALVTVAVIAALMTATCAATRSSAPKSKQPSAKPAAKTVALPKLVEAGSDKCIPCKMMAPILEEIKKEYKGKLDVEIVDVWKDPKAKAKYKVQGIPTQILFDSRGKELARHHGFWPKKEILAEFAKHGIKLEPVAPPKKK